MSEIVLRNYASAAAGYFGSIRIPATMVMGSSLGALFTFPRSNWKPSPDELPDLERFIFRLYHTLVMSSFSLALTTILISSSAAISMLHGKFDPHAETAYQLLRREFDFEFCLTRWCFLVALLFFIIGITCRLILEFKLLARKRRYFLGALLSTSLALASNWLSHINRTLYCWPNLFRMTIYVFQLVFDKAMEGHVLQVVSVAASLSAVGFSLFILFDFSEERNALMRGESRKSL